MSDAEPTTERIDAQNDDLNQVVETVNNNEIPTANDAITSFNSQLQEKASLLSVDVENVSSVDAVEAQSVPEAQDEADRLRTDLDARETAIFDKIVTVINEGDVAEVDRSEIQSPADAREVADRLEEEGGLATQAAESLRDAADLIENDLRPPLNGGADKLDALEVEEPATGRIEGTVTNADGDPVSGATVTVGNETVTTAADGSYAVGLETGDYTLTVSADAYEEASEDVTVEADTTTIVDVTLELTPTDGTLEGTVTETDGEPIAGATVAVGDQQTTTDENGTYSLDLEAGEYTLEVSAEGYENASQNVTIEVETTTTADVVLEERVGSVDGTVTDAEDEPIAGATVTVGDQQTTTADDGTYAVDLEPGEYTLAVSADGYEDASENATVEANSTTTVDVTLEAEPTIGTIDGTVTDADGEPITDATVTAGDKETTTDEKGTYALDLEVGEYTLTVSAEGYEDASEDVTIEADETTTADVTLTETAPEPDADVIVDADVDEKNVTVGETVTVDTDIESAADEEIEVGQYTLVMRYDSDALEFTGIDRPGWQVVDIESAGILVVDRAWVPPGQTDTPVDAFSAEFQAVDGAGEDAGFEFDARASGVEERVFLWKTQPLDAEYDGATVGIEESEDGEVEEPPSDAPEYSDELPVVWDGLTGFSGMAGLETDATPIDDHGPVPVSS